ncbi:hypothetical protein LTR85_008305 [Meristemomyces frigidus]|nr:hypothetical protein LTR85_008305 [Meristemomyces frigidus]
MPPKQRCDELLRSYLHNVEWIHHPLHVPTFQTEYETFWEHYSLPLDSQQKNHQWLALLLVVLCLGSHFDPQRPSVRLAEDLYAASHELLTCSDYLATHSTTAIQTIILMGLWLNDRGLSSTHHLQLALAIKMAVSLGFSKLDAAAGLSGSFEGEDNGFFSLRKGDISTAGRGTERELRRRLWWSLVCQDYYTASSCNFTYTIHPKQSKAHLFLNLDDEELGSDDTISSTVTGHPLEDVATAASYHLLKIPFARVAKAMIDLYNDDELSYTAIINLERLLWTTYDELPEYFKWRKSPDSMIPIPASQYVDRDHLEWQRVFLGFTVHNRVLRLHRPFMARGYIEESMAHSRQATIDSALACLDLADHGQRIGFPGLRWWVILIHIFTSGVALCIDYHFLLQRQIQAHKNHTVTSDPRLLHVRREQIVRTVGLLRPGAGSSIAGARAAAVIDGLIEQAESHSGGAATAAGDGRISKRRCLETRSVAAAPASPPFFTEQSSTGRLTSTEPSVFPLAGSHDVWPNTVDLDDWSGPDWDQLFAFLSEDNSQVEGGMSAELFETVNSFADSFATT